MVEDEEGDEMEELRRRRSSAVWEEDRTREVSLEKRFEQRLRISPEASGRRLE